MFDFSIELQRTNDLLERIAFALERAVGPTLMDPSYKPTVRGPEAMILYGDPKKSWIKEQIKEHLEPMGLSPAQNQEFMDRALKEFADDQES